MHHFPISGVETYWWLPSVVAFAIACFASTGGVSGAFLILPFQVSALGFAGPGASATNLLYNIIAIPSGVYRYWREGRMVWPLAGMIIFATVPATFLGAFLRVRYLAGGSAFKIFVGLVLLYIAARLAADLLRYGRQKPATGTAGKFHVTTHAITLSEVAYSFEGTTYTLSIWKMTAFLFGFGVVAGAYGIGGGALIAPILIAVFRLPVHSIAGATLFSTFVASICGVLFYVGLAPFFGTAEAPVGPDWLLGLLFGVGGAAGIYTGARLQRYVPARVIGFIVLVMTVFIAAKYLLETFF